MKPARLILYALVGVYLVAFGVIAVTQGNREFIYYGLVLAAIIAGLLVMDRRVHFSVGLLWALALWGLAHLAGGTVRVGDGVLYAYWFIPGRLKYDNVVHAYGFFVATLACWQALRAATNARPTLGVLVGVALMGMGLGALNEVIEFAATLLFPETNVGGYVNTSWDLVANLVGATTAAGLIRARNTPKQRRSSTTEDTEEHREEGSI